MFQTYSLIKQHVSWTSAYWPGQDLQLCYLHWQSQCGQGVSDAVLPWTFKLSLFLPTRLHTPPLSWSWRRWKQRVISQLRNRFAMWRQKKQKLVQCRQKYDYCFVDLCNKALVTLLIGSRWLQPPRLWDLGRRSRRCGFTSARSLPPALAPASLSRSTMFPSSWQTPSKNLNKVQGGTATAANVGPKELNE